VGSLDPTGVSLQFQRKKDELFDERWKQTMLERKRVIIIYSKNHWRIHYKTSYKFGFKVSKFIIKYYNLSLGLK
jgi:hypothetical protein